MFERKYKVTMEGQVMAENMTIDTALVLIKALANEYWREMEEQGKISLLEMERIQGCDINRDGTE